MRFEWATSSLSATLPAATGSFRAGRRKGAAPLRPRNDPQGGYGISVVPLRYTSAQTILKLLDNFAIKPGMARADTAHNLILVQGSSPERKLAVDAILSFDVDWMRGQSVGIYPLENASPEEMIKELEQIMASGEGGLNQALITLQPVSRLNAVLVVTRKPNLLRQTAAWISGLTKPTMPARQSTSIDCATEMPVRLRRFSAICSGRARRDSIPQ